MPISASASPRPPKRSPAFAANDAASETLRVEALKLLAHWPQTAGPRPRRRGLPPAARARWRTRRRRACKPRCQSCSLLNSDEVTLAAIDAAAALQVKAAGRALFALIGQKSLSPKVRAARRWKRSAHLTDPKLPDAIQLAVADPDPVAAHRRRRAARQARPGSRRRPTRRGFRQCRGCRRKRRSSSRSAASKLRRRITRWPVCSTSLRKGKIAPEAQLELLEAAAQHPAPEVQAKLKAYADALPKNDPLAAFRVALVGGDKQRGETLFREHAAAACLRCHKVNSTGGEAGPDLSEIGSKKDRAYILESIIAAQREDRGELPDARWSP